MIVNEELWIDPRGNGHLGCIVITANSIVKKNGELVMGAGAAKQAKDRIPGIALEAGNAVLRSSVNAPEGLFYGFTFVRRPTIDRVGLGLFQVKYHWDDPARLDLISSSAEYFATHAFFFPDVNFRMNFPGIGNGKLNYDDVLPLLRSMEDQDNVTICKRQQYS
jgi:hypothetical protein